MKKKLKIALNQSGRTYSQASTGEFVEMKTSKGHVKVSAISRTAVKEASAKRGAALQRLANR